MVGPLLFIFFFFFFFPFVLCVSLCSFWVQVKEKRTIKKKQKEHCTIPLLQILIVKAKELHKHTSGALALLFSNLKKTYNTAHHIYDFFYQCSAKRHPKLFGHLRSLTYPMSLSHSLSFLALFPFSGWGWPGRLRSQGRYLFKRII